MHARSFPWIKLYSFTTSCSKSWRSKLSTIPDKTTGESFTHHVHFPRQQNYFQNDAFAERKPLPPIQCCFLQTPRDQAFFWIHNNIAFRGRGREKNRYGYDVLKNAVQVYNFLDSFVQDCGFRSRRFICEGARAGPMSLSSASKTQLDGPEWSTCSESTLGTKKWGDGRKDAAKIISPACSTRLESRRLDRNIRVSFKFLVFQRFNPGSSNFSSLFNFPNISPVIGQIVTKVQ